MFNCPDFILSLKHWDFIGVFILGSIARPMNITHQLSKVKCKVDVVGNTWTQIFARLCFIGLMIGFYFGTNEVFM